MRTCSPTYGTINKPMRKLSNCKHGHGVHARLLIGYGSRPRVHVIARACMLEFRCHVLSAQVWRPQPQCRMQETQCKFTIICFGSGRDRLFPPLGCIKARWVARSRESGFKETPYKQRPGCLEANDLLWAGGGRQANLQLLGHAAL